MAARILDGKALAARRRAEIAVHAKAFAAEHGRPPGLHVVLVGDDPASVIYTRHKERAASEVGIAGALHKLPPDVSQATLLDHVKRLNDDDAIDGILVQLPLPSHIDADQVIDAIHPQKDVDGFHPLNAGLLASGRPALVPCTPRGIMQLIAESGAELRGARAVVVGRSNIVGKPVAQLLLQQHATVTLAHSRTRDLDAVCREADVLVVAVGRARLVRHDFIKPGAVVIDVGMNRDEDGKLVGDVDPEGARERAGFFTPVPGGVGPMTIACLLENTLTAAERR
jgi:methylenetetrahydrofolate dehydrogenase (NADP+)/methenyltetrahydrofolate cyclohydrolase